MARNGIWCEVVTGVIDRAPARNANHACELFVRGGNGCSTDDDLARLVMNNLNWIVRLPGREDRELINMLIADRLEKLNGSRNQGKVYFRPEWDTILDVTNDILEDLQSEGRIRYVTDWRRWVVRQDGGWIPDFQRVAVGHLMDCLFDAAIRDPNSIRRSTLMDYQHWVYFERCAEERLSLRAAEARPVNPAGETRYALALALWKERQDTIAALEPPSAARVSA